MVHKIQASISHTILIVVVFFFQFNHATDQRKCSSSFINIGVVRNLSSPFGTMIDLCIEMAVSDFYSANPNYKTRLRMRHKDVKDVLDVDLAVVELLEHEQVHGILGPIADTFVAELGRKAHVPIISSASVPLSDTQNPYFVETALDDAVQAQALAAICGEFKWNKVVVLYEDTKYGHQFLSFLNNAFQDVEIGLALLIPISASADQARLHDDLRMLKDNQTIKVFLLHLSDPLVASLLFGLAKKVGMMSEGHAWIIANSLSSYLLSSMDPETRDSMEGVVGVRPYVPPSKNLKRFQENWKINSTTLKINKRSGPVMDLNVYGLWTYDAITALANAVEKIGHVSPSSMYAEATKDKTNSSIRVSSYGPRLQKELWSTRFQGLSGEFQLVDGKLKPSALEIFNVFGTGERRLGFWTPDGGIVRDLNSSVKQTIKKAVWPGDSVTRPKGWSFPPTGPLIVGLPWKKGYTEFVKIASVDDHKSDQVHATGFAIDIFLAALKLLPFPINYTFVCYNGTGNDHTDWTYDDMISGIPEKKFDMVVGDTTILASRASYVDYSLPYCGSGVVQLVKNKKTLDMWTITKPFRWDMWLAILVSCIVMVVVIYILERRYPPPAPVPAPAPAPARDDPGEQPIVNYLIPIAVLAFQERNMVSNKWSSCMLVCWLFTAFILMQSFTASLSANLTVDQLITFHHDRDHYIGYQGASFVKNFLIHELKYNETRLRKYASPKEFHDAMQKGSKNGGVDSIIDEIPYVKLLLNRYDSKYKVYGKTHRAEGLGFAFPVGSPLAAYFSRAILNVTQGPEMISIEQKNFGPGYSSQDPLSSTLSQGTSSLSFHQFAGLFYIVASATVIAFAYSERWVILSASILIKDQLMVYGNQAFYNIKCLFRWMNDTRRGIVQNIGGQEMVELR